MFVKGIFATKGGTADLGNFLQSAPKIGEPNAGILRLNPYIVKRKESNAPEGSSQARAVDCGVDPCGADFFRDAGAPGHQASSLPGPGLPPVCGRGAGRQAIGHIFSGFVGGVFRPFEFFPRTRDVGVRQTRGQGPLSRPDAGPHERLSLP